MKLQDLIRFTSIVVVCFALSSCATEAKIAETPSGYPEAAFTNTSTTKVKNKLMAECDERGYIADSSESSVTCQRTMTGGSAIIAQTLIGNSHSTTPEYVIKFNVYQKNTSVKVTARQWIETQMAFGQIQRQEVNSGQNFNFTQQMLYNIGGK